MPQVASACHIGQHIEVILNWNWNRHMLLMVTILDSCLLVYHGYFINGELPLGGTKCLIVPIFTTHWWSLSISIFIRGSQNGHILFLAIIPSSFISLDLSREASSYQ